MPPQPEQPDESPRQPTFVMGVALLLLPVLFVYLLIAMWPCACPDKDACCNAVTFFNTATVVFNPETQLLWIVVLAATIGSFVHVATSFATFVGNRSFSRSWLWWYVLRAPIGVCLALILYFVVRGGLFSGSASANTLNPYGIAALSGLAGMFSKQAADKLREVFDNFFRTIGKGDAARADKLTDEIRTTATTQATVGDQTVTTAETRTVDTDPAEGANRR